MLNPESTPALQLYRFKQRCQKNVVSCSHLAPDVLGTAWVELFQTQGGHYACQLYAVWYKDVSDLQAASPLLLWDEVMHLPDRPAEDALAYLKNRFDRLMVEKNRVLLRDHEAIVDPRHLAYPEYWKEFLSSNAIASGDFYIYCFTILDIFNIIIYKIYTRSYERTLITRRCLDGSATF